MEDSVIRPVEGIEGGYCSKCNTIKPLKAFTRLLTFAESKRRGYVGNHRVEVIDSLCKPCQPKRIRRERMTRNQIHNAVDAGDMGLFDAEVLLRRRDMQATEGKRRGAYSRWAKARQKRWAPLIFQLNKDMAILHQQEKNGRIKGNQAIVDYAARYKQVLNNIRYRMRKDCDILEMEPPEDWRTLIKPQEMEDIKVLWVALPNRHRMKIPALLNPHYVPPVPKDELDEGFSPIMMLSATAGSRNLEGDRELRERKDFMEEVRAQKLAERDEREREAQKERDAQVERDATNDEEMHELLRNLGINPDK